MSGFIVNLAKLNVTEFRADAIDAIKNNILGIRDIMSLQGMVPGWDRSISGTEEPTRIMFKSTQSGTEWVAVTNITYSSGKMTYAKYMYSNNSTDGTDGSWSNLADSAGKYICTYTYDGNGDLTSTTWS